MTGMDIKCRLRQNFPGIIEKRNKYVACICMWICFFAGITAILAKVGIKKIDSNLATAIRTIVVLILHGLWYGLPDLILQLEV